MLLQLQKYSLTVKYKKGKHMFLADSAHLPEVHACRLSEALEDINHTKSLELPDSDSSMFQQMTPYCRNFVRPFRRAGQKASQEYLGVSMPTMTSVMS